MKITHVCSSLLLGIGTLACYSDRYASHHDASPKTAASVESVAAREYVAQAANGGRFEVESSELAATRAASEPVKSFARMMMEDHGAANRKLQSLAQSKGVPIPASLESEQQRALDELRNLTGSAFDKRYCELQTKAHEDAIELFERAVKDCPDAEVRAFAKETLPTLRKHLDHLKQMPVDPVTAND